MTNRLSLEMLKATRLTRAGRLVEATEFLQHVLHGESPVLPTGEAVRDSFEVTDTPSSSPARPAFDFRMSGWPAGGAAAPHLPNSLRGLLERMKRIGLQTEPGGPVSRSPAQACDIVPEGGQFLERSYSNHAGGRPYKLYVPSGYRGQAVPLIVMLHGCTQSPDDFAAGTRMNEMAEEHTCLVVYPAQVASANASKCWNWFSQDNQQRGQGEPALIAGITREVMAEYRIDQQRVYVAGLSAGGAAAAIMGATYPDLYAAIGVHSGLACGSASDLPSAFAAMRRVGGSAGSQAIWLSKMGHEQIGANQRAVPTIVFHGDQDKTVHPCNGDEVLTQFGAATAELQTTVESGRVPSGHSYSRTRLCDASGQTVFENWVIHGAGHAWSGGSPAGSYTDPRGPDATREMFRFFREQAHPMAERPV
jgi:poly(hydroxyalkanoate) depolymerase family esterase